MIREKRNISIEKISKIAEIMKTISHPVRLQILEALEAHESLNVTELQKEVSIETEQSLLSHHLIKMKDKGILRCERRGMNVYYSLADRTILSLFDCMEKCPMI